MENAANHPRHLNGQSPDISPTDPLGEPDIQALYDGLAEFPIHNPPQRLYRFFSARATSSLTDGLLKLTPPIQFNDPFEVWAGLSGENLTEELMMHSVLSPRSLFRLARCANYPGYDFKAMEFDQQIAAAVKQKPEFYRAHFKSLVDSVASACANDIGVSCFSGFSPEEFAGELGIHHWAMYGDSHAGFALAYDGEHPQIRGFANTKWLFPVEYVERRHTVDLAYFDEWTDRKMWRTFRHWLALKSRRAWEHEKEWRLAFPVKAVPNPLFVQQQAPDGRTLFFLRLWDNAKPDTERTAHASIISAVFLGTRATPELTACILAAVDAPHLRHVQVCKMEVDESRYALVTRELRAGDMRRAKQLREHLRRA
jgi:hypothetical protein